MSRNVPSTLFMILLLIIALAACNAGSIQDENLQAVDSGLIDDIPDDELEKTEPNETAETTPDFDINTVLNSILEATDDVIDDEFGYSDLSGIEFWFGSGVGAWCTVAYIDPDGTFTGYFQDSDMGDNGDDYPDGTRYECYFSGKFSPLRKSGDFEYSMICESLASEGIFGEEQIVDGVKLITWTPYGFDDANEFFLYLPGKKTAELPEGFLSWSQGTAGEGELTCYGLYNVGGKQGFIG